MSDQLNRRVFLKMTGMGGIGLASGMFENQKEGNPIGKSKKIGVDDSQQTDWNLFDANCMIGRHLKMGPDDLYTADHLLREMDHYGIAEALVVDSLSRENHPFDGNLRIQKEVRRYPRLYSAWSVLPSILEETGRTPQAFVKEMKDYDIRAVFLYPNQYLFNLSDWCIDALVEPLAHYKIPVFINPVEANGRGGADATDWQGIIDLCKRWPQLPVIISENRIRRSQRILYKAFDQCPNLRLELSAYWLHRGIEFITEKWGSKRLLFGSGWPKFGQHMTQVNLTTAQISASDKRNIAGDNLRSLLSWNKPISTHKVKFPAPGDEFVAYGRSGERPSNMRFYDVHGHLGEYNAHYHVPGAKLNKVVEDLHYYGVEKSCVFSFSGVYSDEQFGNDIIAEAALTYPDQFVGFTLLNPLRGKEEMIRELERNKKKGSRGIKLIPTYQGYPVDGDLIEVACQWAHQHRQIIINHDWGPAAHIEALVSKYPKACFVAGHSYRFKEYNEVLKKYPNLFVCSCPLQSPRACEEMVQEIGADRLLFGSDLLDLPIGWGLGPILFARISAEEKKLILRDNLRKILSVYSQKESIS